MSLVSRSSRRFLSRHPGQAGLTLLGVALGVAVVVSIDLAIQSAREAFQVSTETVAGRATHQVVGAAAGVPNEWLSRIRIAEGLREAAPVVEGYLRIPQLPGRPLRLLGIDPLSEAPFRPALSGAAGGLDLSSFLTRPGAIVLSAGTAAEAGLEPGDTLTLDIDGRERQGLLVGVLELADEPSRRGFRDLVVTDLAQAQDLLGQENLTRIDLRLPPPGEGEERWVQQLESILPPGLRLVETGARTRGLSNMIRAFDLNLTALSLLALVFGMFLIYNTMTFSVVQRRPLLGSLRALGVTRSEVFRLILREAAVLGAVGTVLGLGLGVLLGRGLVRLVTRTINDLYFVVSVEGLALPPEVLLKGAFLGIGATLLSALPPAAEATGSPPRATLTRSLLEDRARVLVPRAALAGLGLAGLGVALLWVPSRSILLAFAGLFGVLMGMALITPWATVHLVRWIRPLVHRIAGILGTLAARGVVAALSRTAPAIASLVVAVAVTVGLGVMIGSFRQTVVDWLEGTLRADVYVSPPTQVSSRTGGTIPQEVVDRLVRTEGVAGVSTYRATLIDREEGPLRVVALELDPRGEGAFDFAEGSAEVAFPLFREGGGVLVSEPFAYRAGLGVGDTVRIPSDRGEAALPVAGVFYDYGSDRGVVMMARTTYDRWYRDDGITSLGFFAAEGTEVDALVERLRARATGAESLVVQSNRALKESSLEIFDRTFAITGVLRLLAFAVAFIGVLSALMALQLERAREFGVLRANGMTPRQLWALVTAQTGILGTVAGVLAIPAGLVLAVVMIFVVNQRSFGWTLRMEVGPEVLLQAVGLALMGALLAGIYPAWRMSRTSPALALREE